MRSKIAQKISQDSNEESTQDDIDEMHHEIIKNYLAEIIEIQFKLIPELNQVFYGAFTIHVMNLAFEASKLDGKDRSMFIKKLSDYEQQKYKLLIIPLLNFTDSQIFSEDYEKELSTVVSIFHLAVPIFNL